MNFEKEAYNKEVDQTIWNEKLTEKHSKWKIDRKIKMHNLYDNKMHIKFLFNIWCLLGNMFIVIKTSPSSNNSILQFNSPNSNKS